MSETTISDVCGELRSVARDPGIWSKVPPDSVGDDEALRFMLSRGLIRWQGMGGYIITAAGLEALAPPPQSREE